MNTFSGKLVKEKIKIHEYLCVKYQHIRECDVTRSTKNPVYLSVKLPTNDSACLSVCLSVQLLLLSTLSSRLLEWQR